MDETLEKAMNLLLNNFWITKDFDKEEYYYLKQRSNKIREFITKNLGNKFIVHDRFLKLEKIPAMPIETAGIPEFMEPLDYILLLSMLLYLEDKARGERFILSSVIGYLKSTAIALELNHIPDWKLGSHRKSLSRVLKYLESIHVLILNDREKVSFEESENADALYEVTGISNYMIPTFYQNLENLETPEDFIRQEWNGQTEEKGDIRRFKVYRHLLYEAASSKMDWTPAEEDYFKKIHNGIKKELQDNLQMETEITKNLAMIYVEESTEPNYFPNAKKISDIILLVNSEVINYAKEKNILLDEQECFTIHKKEFMEILNNLREKKQTYFSKQILDLSFAKYAEEIVETMKKYCFIKEKEETFLILPTVYRYLGKISDKTGQEEKIENLAFELEVE